MRQRVEAARRILPPGSNSAARSVAFTAVVKTPAPFVPSCPPGSLPARPARPTRPTGGNRRGRRGQALVEFAFVIPVFLLVLAGIVDAGFMLYSRMTVINAAREGARAAVTQIDNPTGIPDVVENAVSFVAPSLNSVDLSVATTCVTADEINGVGSPRLCDFVASGSPDPKSGDAVKVSVTYIYHSYFLQLWGNSLTLTSSVQMVLE